jgi:hypothetical protein
MIGIGVAVALAVLVATSARAELVCDAKVHADVVAKQKPKAIADCLDPSKPPASIVPASATVKVTVRAQYDQKGTVISSTIADASGPHAEGIAACLAARLRSWNFECGPGSTDVPFELKR